MTPQQSRMFGADDLPLFSGSTMHVEVHPFVQQPAAKQARLAACPICLDTGYGYDRPCTCGAGPSVAADIRGISSGTLATLTGERNYQQLDAIHARFIEYACDHRPEHGWDNRQAAWSAFWWAIAASLTTPARCARRSR